MSEYHIGVLWSRLKCGQTKLQGTRKPWRRIFCHVINLVSFPIALTRFYLIIIIIIITCHQDGKRPDGLTVMPFEGGRALTWDVTVICSMADSYIDLAVQGSRSAAELAASRKQAKYVDLQSANCGWNSRSNQRVSLCLFGRLGSTDFALWLARTGSACFCFSEIQWLSSTSTRFFYMTILFLSTTRITSHSNFSLYINLKLPWELGI